MMTLSLTGHINIIAIISYLYMKNIIVQQEEKISKPVRVNKTKHQQAHYLRCQSKTGYQSCYW